MFRPTSILVCVIVVGCILVQARNPIRRPENKLRGARDGPVIEEKPIPSGAIRLKTGTYLFLNHLLSWESARMQCRFNGMDLVAIETPEENRAISMYARLTGGIELRGRVGVTRAGETPGTGATMEAKSPTPTGWAGRTTCRHMENVSDSSPEMRSGPSWTEQSCVHLFAN
ncbi:hypothetical protein B566_EDAN007071 [Ephemera danica]|nr:hypothetical protein B566_EDAN007071 [Ephemera danica]